MCSATHLLESGTDLSYIQEFLGYKRSRTIEIYTHFSTRSLQNIKSIFDDL
ncbi:tyrosine-type recombinase/integrase [Wandonia haliotis]|uniref:tyrosine-type recombinase/integrase n=1 Tax=Wandonia haliotis TaxID=574963 RepID=UPI0031D5FC59